MSIAIVTGASSGMGREFVRQLAARGEYDAIWAVARRAERLAALQEEVPIVRPLPVDLTDPAAIAGLLALLAEEKPAVAVLVNASGYGRFGSHEEIPVADEQNMIDLNVKALVALTEGVLPFMTKGSRIVELGSLSSFQPTPYLNVYAAGKAFVLSYARGLNAELRPRGITVTALCPGWVRTEFFDHADVISPTAVTKRKPLYEADYVVSKGLKAAFKGKDICIPGAMPRTIAFWSHRLPFGLVARAWEKIRH
ncbi:MAG: SDR family NAD(P)-dependent oxidoreductase [Clostridia bacterium]|nr:SDR family NAD(P)-dependent oxidoreductase [Clostridia bacterium]